MPCSVTVRNRPYHAPMPRGRLAPVVQILPAAAVCALLAFFVDIDPSTGFTFSNSPFTDEAWWLANARNYALFGQWSTDDWNLHLVSPVYSAMQAAVLLAAGVDMMPARLAVIASVGLTCVALAFGLRRVLGDLPAFIAALAYGFSPLTLFYGRLAYGEPVVALALTTGAVLVASGNRRPAVMGVVAGLVLAAAIGTKPTALPLVLGMLVGLLLIDGRRSVWSRRWVAGATATVLALGLAWTVFVLIPERYELAAVGRILAPITVPGDVSELFRRILSYPVSNDRALIYALPLLTAAAAGTILAWRHWHDVPEPARRLIAVAAGWFAFGLILLLVIPYRPNRYFLPLVPALSILAASALYLVPRYRPKLPKVPRGAKIALVAGTLMTPGLLLYATWISSATRDLGQLQRTVASLIPAGEAVEGAYAPLLAFKAPVVAIVSRPESDINSGDLYTAQRVRWVAVEANSVPAWAAQHVEAWNSREIALCDTWGNTALCLVRVP